MQLVMFPEASSVLKLSKGQNLVFQWTLEIPFMNVQSTKSSVVDYRLREKTINLHEGYCNKPCTHPEKSANLHHPRGHALTFLATHTCRNI